MVVIHVQVGKKIREDVQFLDGGFRVNIIMESLKV
jgi:hypothetical protein